MLGRFVEFAVPTASLAKSLAFYSGLGFRLAPDNGAEETRHVVVSDGRISIGLWPDTIIAPTLVFVRTGIRDAQAMLERYGLSVRSVVTDDYAFNHLSAVLPNGTPLRLIEARTHSPVEPKSTCLGWFEEVAFASPAERIEVWQSLGFVALSGTDESPYATGSGVSLACNSVTLGLERPIHPASMCLSFECDDFAQARDHFDRTGISYTERAYADSAQRSRLIVVAPEGTTLVLHKTT